MNQLNWKTLVIVPANTNIQRDAQAPRGDVVVVKNTSETAKEARGVSVSRILLIGLTEADLVPELVETCKYNTASYMGMFGTRPIPESV